LQDSRVYVIKDNKIIRFSQEHEHQYIIHTGIIGKSISLNKEINTENGENDPMFNVNVDLHTTLPLYTLPI